VVALVRSFHDRRLKCLTNSTASRAAVLGTAAAITTIWQRRVSARAQVQLSKCRRNLVLGSRHAVGVTYAPSSPWCAACRTSPVVLFSSSRKDLLSTRPPVLHRRTSRAADLVSAASPTRPWQLGRGEGASPPPYLGGAHPRRPRFSISTRVKAKRELSVDSRAPKPVPIAHTPLRRLHASLAAARRLFPERSSQRARLRRVSGA
jgi:hypothetical protein